MSTHATIAVKKGEKVLLSHLTYDGYPSNVLPELVNKYATEDKALELISKGRIHEINGTKKDGERTGCPTYTIDVQPFNCEFSYDSEEDYLNVSVLELDYMALKEINYEKIEFDYESMYYYLFENGEWFFAPCRIDDKKTKWTNGFEALRENKRVSK